MPAISLITIGSELLKGRIVNTNATDVGLMLRSQGYELLHNLSIPDEPGQMRMAIENDLAACDVVILSGGLGPTRDDLTKHLLAGMFNSPLVEDAATLAWLREMFAQRGRELSELNRQQALVPAACEVMPNPRGTAPGMCFRQDGKLLFSLPGVPYEMRHMLEHEVLPRIRKAFSPGYVRQRILRLAHIPESAVAERMADIEDAFSPLLSVSYLPRLDGIWLELGVSVPEAQAEEAERALEEGFAKVQDLLADKRYGEGTAGLGEMLGEALMARHFSIATAESLTGGLAASRIVSAPGASQYFKGGLCAYDTAIKSSVLDVPESLIEAEGVVSSATACAMAEAARRLFGADIGLASTGRADTDDAGNLAGAWLAYADARGSHARWVELYADRNTNRERAANMLLVEALLHLS